MRQQHACMQSIPLYYFFVISFCSNIQFTNGFHNQNGDIFLHVLTSSFHNWHVHVGNVCPTGLCWTQMEQRKKFMDLIVHFESHSGKSLMQFTLKIIILQIKYNLGMQVNWQSSAQRMVIGSGFDSSHLQMCFDFFFFCLHYRPYLIMVG